MGQLTPLNTTGLWMYTDAAVNYLGRSRTCQSSGKSAGSSVKSAMHRRKKGTLKSGKGGEGGKIKSKKQAIAIGLSEARKKRAKGPKKKSSSKKKSEKSSKR